MAPLYIVFTDSTCLLDLDGKHIGVFPADARELQRIGFRGGYRNSFVDDVVVKEVGGGKGIRESFSNRNYILGYFILIAFVGVAVDLLVFVGARGRVLKGVRALMAVITVNLVLLAIASLSWGYFVFVFSKQYPLVDEELLTQEEEFVERRTDAVTETLIDSCRNRSSNMALVLFLGTSQTWGAGATNAGEDFVSRIQSMFRDDHDVSVHCINGGVSGQGSSGLLNVYKDEWITCIPSIVVINLSHNDNVPDEFSENLTEFAGINRRRGIKTLFVTEPLSIEKFPSRKESHQVMRNVAATNRVPLVDMHAYLGEHYDSGFLWWIMFIPPRLVTG